MCKSVDLGDIAIAIRRGKPKLTVSDNHKWRREFNETMIPFKRGWCRRYLTRVNRIITLWDHVKSFGRSIHHNRSCKTESSLSPYTKDFRKFLNVTVKNSIRISTRYTISSPALPRLYGRYSCWALLPNFDMIFHVMASQILDLKSIGREWSRP